MTPELQGMLSSLIPTPKSPSPSSPSPSSPSGPAGLPERAAPPPAKKTKSEPEIFSTPQHYVAKCNSLGGSVLDVVAMTGDEIIVCGSHNKFALAYNPRNSLAGRIPFDHLQKGKSESVVTSSLYRARDPRTVQIACRTDGNILSWLPGHYIRVYRWDDPHAKPKKSGIAINLATKQIGRFYQSGYSFDLIGEGV